MTTTTKAAPALPDDNRHLAEYRGLTGKIVAAIAICFSLFQLYTGLFGVLDAQLQRSVHLGFGLVLIFLLYPSRKRWLNRRFPHPLDMALAVLGGAAPAYLIVEYHELVLRAGNISGTDFAVGLLGVLLVIDDYFHCLTVGSVMRPVTDKHNVSRAKLAYLIDATAAPVCIIAPISSWAAAVAGFASGAGVNNGMELFIRAIPYNFYALLTIVMMIFMAVSKFDYGPMKKHEYNAVTKGDLFTTGKEDIESAEAVDNPKGRVCDLVIPIIVLVILCMLGMIYTGGFFTEGEEGFRNFAIAFSNCSAGEGLAYGSFGAIIFAVIFYLCRRVISFKQCMESIPEGFKAMVPAILILCCAWTLKTMTDSLGAKVFVSQLIEGSASGLRMMLPAIIFLIAVGLSFATGTSWGTFGILIPIVLSVFSGTDGNITIIAISACMAGAVCGDHCSPISDTTIMSSAGAQCRHINHVSTQLPYAMTVAGVSFVSYIIAGLIQTWISLPIAIVLMLATLFVLKAVLGKKGVSEN